MLILKTETVLFNARTERMDAMNYKENTKDDGWEMAYTATAISFTRNQIMHVDLGKE